MPEEKHIYVFFYFLSETGYVENCSFIIDFQGQCNGLFKITLPGGKQAEHCQDHSLTFATVRTQNLMTITNKNLARYQSQDFECTVALQLGVECHDCAGKEDIIYNFLIFFIS